MKINTKSLHYRLYEFTYSVWSASVPERTNLCQYIRRLMLSPFILLPVSGIYLLAGIVLAVRAILTYPLGYATNWKSFELRERSPGLFQVGGSQFYSGYILFPVALIVANAFAYVHLPSSGAVHINGVQQLSIVFLILEAAALMLGVLFGTFLLFFSTDTWDLATEWFDAKTEGVCPLIEFDEEDE